MENYNEEVNSRPKGESPRMVPRLQFVSGRYFFSIFDRKLKKTLFKSYDEEKTKSAIKQLRETSDLSQLPSTEGEVPPPKLLVVEEKHGTRSYDVSTPDKLFKASLELVNQRVDNGYYYLGEIGELEYDLGLTEEEINKLPEGKVKKYAKELLESIKKHKKSVDFKKRTQKILKEAIESQDGKLAYEFLEENRDWGYDDSFKIIEPGFC